MPSWLSDFLENFLAIWLESAPWLILGLTIAGLMKAFIPKQWMQNQLGGQRRINVIKAAFIGAPLPLCSCGVVPAAMGLRRAGASKGSTVAFLVATPETGPDSVTLSYALLGPFMAIIRPIAAVTSAIVAGLLVRHETHESSSETLAQSKGDGCCASEKAAPAAASCCGSKAPKEPSKSVAVWEGLNYSFGQLLKDISGWLLLGLAVAAIIQTFIPADWLAQWGQGWSALLLMTVIGVPMYICASASTPIAAGFLAAGVSPGAVLVFMLAGPATNIGTLGIIRKELGNHALVAYLTGVIATALGFGLLTDYLVSQYHLMDQIVSLHSMEHNVAWWSWIMGGALLLLMFNAQWPHWLKVFNANQKVSQSK